MPTGTGGEPAGACDGILAADRRTRRPCDRGAARCARQARRRDRRDAAGAGPAGYAWVLGRTHLARHSRFTDAVEAFRCDGPFEGRTPLLPQPALAHAALTQVSQGRSGRGGLTRTAGALGSRPRGGPRLGARSSGGSGRDAGDQRRCGARAPRSQYAYTP
jgi:hypothetical protein